MLGPPPRVPVSGSGAASSPEAASTASTARTGSSTIPPSITRVILPAWNWSAGLGRTEDDRRVGWNVVTGIHDAREASERTLWVEGRPRELGAVEIAADLSRVVVRGAQPPFLSGEAGNHRAPVAATCTLGVRSPRLDGAWSRRKRLPALAAPGAKNLPSPPISVYARVH